MRELPILFSAPMVQAIRAGNKTQTRRVIKLPSIFDMESEYVGFAYANTAREGHSGKGWYCYANEYTDEGSELVKCPYGEKGDRLWVRESFAYGTQPNQVFYRADMLPGHAHTLKWRPSIHMPKSACRLWLKVGTSHPEPLQSISAGDLVREGWEGPGTTKSDALDWFHVLWDTLNADRGYPYSSNPWVWVVRFKVVET